MHNSVFLAAACIHCKDNTSPKPRVDNPEYLQLTLGIFKTLLLAQMCEAFLDYRQQIITALSPVVGKRQTILSL